MVIRQYGFNPMRLLLANNDKSIKLFLKFFKLGYQRFEI